MSYKINFKDNLRELLVDATSELYEALVKEVII